MAVCLPVHHLAVDPGRYLCWSNVNMKNILSNPNIVPYIVCAHKIMNSQPENDTGDYLGSMSEDIEILGLMIREHDH